MSESLSTHSVLVGVACIVVVFLFSTGSECEKLNFQNRSLCLCPRLCVLRLSLLLKHTELELHFKHNTDLCSKMRFTSLQLHGCMKLLHPGLGRGPVEPQVSAEAGAEGQETFIYLAKRLAELRP